MKKQFGLGLFLSLSLSSSFTEKDADRTLEQKEEIRKVSSFNELLVDNGLIVELVKGTENKLDVGASKEMVSRIATKNKNGKLTIFVKGKKSWKGSPKILLTFIGLDKITTKGTSRVFSQRKLELNKLDIVTKSSSSIKLNLSTESLSIKSSSVSIVELEGSSDLIKIKGVKASRIEAFGLNTSHAEVKITDAAKANVSVEKNLKVEVSDVGMVRYKNKPENITSKVEGVARLVSEAEKE